MAYIYDQLKDLNNSDIINKNNSDVINKNFVISISPNGKELVSLDILKDILQTWQLSNDLSPINHEWSKNDHSSYNINSSWSIAISDRDDEDNMFIAVSRVNYNNNLQYNHLERTSVSSSDVSFSFRRAHNHNLSVPSVDSNTLVPSSHSVASISSNFNLNIEEQEYAIIIIHDKAGQRNKIKYSSLQGGIVKFIDSSTLVILQDTEFTRIIFNENGKVTLPEDAELPKLPRYPYPKSMIDQLNMRSLKSAKALINNTIIKNHFFLSKSTQNHNIFEMYNLDNSENDSEFLELEHVFQTRKILNFLGCKHINDGAVRTPLFAMSENGKLLAISLCKKIVAIFLIENSLLVAVHDFCNTSNCDCSTATTSNTKSAKILDMKFFDKDEKLVILTQEPSGIYTTIWDLFNCNSHSPYTAHLDPSIIINKEMKKCEQTNGRPLGIFSNYLVYPNRSVGIDLVPFEHKEKIGDYKTKIDSNQPNFYNNFSQSKNLRYKIFDCEGIELVLSDKNDLIIEDSEPWDNTDNKLQIVVWLNEKKSIQLIIGNETIQVWERNKKLVYIWTPLLSEEYYDTPPTLPNSPNSIRTTHPNDSGSDKGIFRIHQFVLKKFTKKITTSDQYQYKIKFRFGCKRISGYYLPRDKDYIKSACNAIEFLERQMTNVKRLDNKLRRYLHKTIQETRSLIKNFISEQPQTWKLLDIKECNMSCLVAAGCDDLVSYIVDEKRCLMLHNPRRFSWSKVEFDECSILFASGKEKSERSQQKNSKQVAARLLPQQRYSHQKRTYSDKEKKMLKKHSDLEIAICHKNKNAVKGLVKYYSTLAMENTGWMFTVSENLFELHQYNSDYVVELFYQPIFGAKEAPHLNNLNKASITSEIPLPGSKNSLRALYDIQTKLSKPKKPTNITKPSIHNIKDFSSSLDLSDTAPWVMTCMVPLPDFTVPNDNGQSPFTRMVQKSALNDNNFMFDNPAIEAIVNFKWYKYAKKRIYFLLGLYAFYQMCFAFLCYAYISDNLKLVWVLPPACLVLFLGLYLLISEANQARLLRKGYFGIYNVFDLLSSILPLLCTILLLKISFVEWLYGKKDIKIDLTVLGLLSITMLTLWIELLMRMRSLQFIGEYVFIIINLSKRISPFLGTMFVIICGLAHSMHILLSHPKDTNLIRSPTTYTLLNSATQENYTLTENVDDNSFTDYFTSIKAVYFWINGQWDQLDQWNYWAVTVLIIFGSLFLVIIMQNILIALMSDVVDEAKEIGKRAFLKLRAELITEIEISLTAKQFKDKNLFPRHIYYVINFDEVEQWLENEKCKKREKIGYFNNGEKVTMERGRSVGEN